MKRKQFSVIGLGRFGLSIAESLQNMGHQVLVVDVDKDRIQEVSETFTYAACADTTNSKTIVSLELKEFDTVVIAIGDDIQSSILTCLLLKEAGCPYIVAKANTRLHAAVLDKIGADRVVFPEKDMGLRVARSLVSTDMLDFIEISPDISIIEVKAHEHMVGHTLQELQVRTKHGVNVMAIKNKDGEIMVSPGADDLIQKGDILVVVGDNKALGRLNWL